MTRKSLENRRSERLAAKETERREDAELDSPVLKDLATEAEALKANAVRCQDLVAQLVVKPDGLTRTATGLAQIAANLGKMIDVLTSEADKALADG